MGLKGFKIFDFLNCNAELQKISFDPKWVLLWRDSLWICSSGKGFGWERLFLFGMEYVRSLRYGNCKYCRVRICDVQIISTSWHSLQTNRACASMILVAPLQYNESWFVRRKYPCSALFRLLFYVPYDVITFGICVTGTIVRHSWNGVECWLVLLVSVLHSTYCVEPFVGLDRLTGIVPTATLPVHPSLPSEWGRQFFHDDVNSGWPNVLSYPKFSKERSDHQKMMHRRTNWNLC